MRGKVTQDLVDLVKSGITPAYAGKRTSRYTPFQGAKDHPRVCGEKTGTAWRWLMVTGSPPRMRGKVPAAPSAPMSSGITPAYAGKSILQSATRWPRRDHPRVCGEKPLSLVWMTCETGSPPRMRGKVELGIKAHVFHRITPAYAGKRKSYSKHKKHHRDHPRVCGEKCVCVCVCVGSPPRMRGKD